MADWRILQKNTSETVLGCTVPGKNIGPGLSMPSLPDLPQKFVPNDLRLKTESLSIPFIIGAELH